MLRKMIIGLLFLGLFMNLTIYAADVAKIGIVDLQKIIDNSAAGKAAKEEINGQGKKMEGELKKRWDAIEAMRKKLDQESVIMDKETREEKQRDFRIQVNDFKTLQKKYDQDLRETEKRLVSQIKKDLLDIVQKIGKDEGYLLMLEKVGILYAPTALNVTDQVIVKYDESYTKKKK